MGDRLTAGLQALIEKYGLPFVAFNQGSICHLDNAGTMHFAIDWKKPWTIPELLRQTGIRQKEMEHMGAAYMAEGIGHGCPKLVGVDDKPDLRPQPVGVRVDAPLAGGLQRSPVGSVRDVHHRQPLRSQVLVRNAAGGDDKRQAVAAEAEAWPDCRAFLLRSHGALCLGRDMEDAFAAARALEEVCSQRCRSVAEAAADGEPVPDWGVSWRRGDAFLLELEGERRSYPVAGRPLPPIAARNRERAASTSPAVVPAHRAPQPRISAAFLPRIARSTRPGSARTPSTSLCPPLRPSTQPSIAQAPSSTPPTSGRRRWRR